MKTQKIIAELKNILNQVDVGSDEDSQVFGHVSLTIETGEKKTIINFTAKKDEDSEASND